MNRTHFHISTYIYCLISYGCVKSYAYLFACCGIYFAFHHRYLFCALSLVVFVNFYWTAIISGIQWKLKTLSLPLMTYAFPLLLHRSPFYLKLDSQYWGWLLPTLILTLITASATPENPSGASKSDSPSTVNLIPPKSLKQLVPCRLQA